MSNLFNLPTDRAPQWDNMIKERYDLLEKSETVLNLSCDDLG